MSFTQQGPDYRLRNILLDGGVIRVDGKEYVKIPGDICPGDMYFAQRHSGPKILICYNHNKNGWIESTTINLCYETRECVRIEERAPEPPAEIGPSDYTWEVSSKEPLHPDPEVVRRMYEVAISDCPYGCKIYADPKSHARVLAHNSTYGCPK